MKFESSLVFLNVYTMNYTYSNDLYMYQKKKCKIKKKEKKTPFLNCKKYGNILYIIHIYWKCY